VAGATHDEPVALRRRRYGLAVLLSIATVSHVLRPSWFLGMIPSWLPGGRRRLHRLATVAEAVSALLLWVPRTRRIGGAAAATTLLGVYLANIEAVRLGGYAGAPGWLSTRTAAILRLPLQVPLVWWAVRVARGR
jgi:uncharacterized membrane protein